MSYRFGMMSILVLSGVLFMTIDRSHGESRVDNKSTPPQQPQIQSAKNPPYWLVDFKSQNDFKIRSLALAEKIPTYTVAKVAVLCVAVFSDAGFRGKDAFLYCTSNAANGYNTACDVVSVNLSNDALEVQENLPMACNDFATYRFWDFGRPSSMIAYALKGGVSDIGVYVYKDQFGVIPRWAASKLSSPSPAVKASKAKTH